MALQLTRRTQTYTSNNEKLCTYIGYLEDSDAMVGYAVEANSGGLASNKDNYAPEYPFVVK